MQRTKKECVALDIRVWPGNRLVRPLHFACLRALCETPPRNKKKTFFFCSVLFHLARVYLLGKTTKASAAAMTQSCHEEEPKVVENGFCFMEPRYASRPFRTRGSPLFLFLHRHLLARHKNTTRAAYAIIKEHLHY